MSEPGLIDAEEPRILGGKYRVGELLGEGGMGRVYRGTNTLLEREVAIKILRPELATNDRFRQRFLREARNANKVRHPNIVDVLDLGLDESGAPFIVQELLHGETLGAMIERKGALSPEKALRLMLPVINAVAHAHEVGVVHRDLKPENVFLMRVEGGTRPKVLDFGISKPLFATDVNDEATADGVILGTPAYMSPEQIIGGGKLDTRSDVWSLGVIFYELIAGHLPYRDLTPRGLFQALCSEDPRALGELAPHVPPAIEKVVMRCLRRDAASRYATARELERDVRLCLDGQEPEETQRFAKLSIPPPKPVETEPHVAPIQRASLSDAESPSSDVLDSPDEAPQTAAVKRSAGSNADALTLVEVSREEALRAPAAAVTERVVRAKSPLSWWVIVVSVLLAVAMLAAGLVYGRGPAGPVAPAAPPR